MQYVCNDLGNHKPWNREINMEPQDRKHVLGNMIYEIHSITFPAGHINMLNSIINFYFSFIIAVLLITLYSKCCCAK